jgi:nucleoside-diphosphate-sugar epimerase
MRVLITGGNGFIGNEILNLLIKKRYKVLNLCRNNIKKNSYAACHKCDLFKPKTYIKKIINFNPQILIHLAWNGIPNFNKKNCNQNEKFSKKLINETAKIKSIKKIIVAGSCFEIKYKKNSCNEKKLFDTNSNFTHAKYEIFKHLKKISEKKNKKYYWLRIFYAYGPNQKNNSILPYIYNSLKKKYLIALKNPYNELDFINTKDIARYFVKIIECKTPAGIYNVGSGKSISIIKIFKFIKKILNKNNSEFFSENNKKTKFYSDNNKSIKIINFNPRVNIFTGIKEQLNSFNTNDK